jgi:hypothetical protein
MTERFRIVVTDVTIYGKLRCVAGWDLDRKCMVRPEPGPGSFWPALVCGRNTTFHPGYVVEFRATKPTTSFPHQTEDWVVRGEASRTDVLSLKEFNNTLLQSQVVGPKGIWAALMKKSGTTAYVLEGVECGSLCAVKISRDKLRLAVKDDAGWKKPRAKLVLGENEIDLSIAAKNLRQAYDREGLDGIKKLTDSSQLHLRLGLARALDHTSGERRCYLQINGIYPV